MSALRCCRHEMRDLARGSAFPAEERRVECQPLDRRAAHLPTGGSIRHYGGAHPAKGGTMSRVWEVVVHGISSFVAGGCLKAMIRYW
jgi:hypothetical protein